MLVINGYKYKGKKGWNFEIDFPFSACKGTTKFGKYQIKGNIN